MAQKVWIFYAYKQHASEPSSTYKMQNENEERFFVPLIILQILFIRQD
jgi:hypothetical protein